ARRQLSTGSPQAPEGAGPEPGWDRMLDELRSDGDEPDVALVGKETIELAYLVAIRHLSPTTRAVLILRGVLGWSARDTAAPLGASIASVTRALQRARATSRRHLATHRLEWSPGAEPSVGDRALVERYVEATQRVDADALLAVIREEAGRSSPPGPRQHIG